MAQPLFGKVCTLTVGEREFTDFRVTYSIKRTSRSKPNPAELTITGLAPTTREAISQRLTPVRLIAGYSGTAGQLFSGQLDSAITVKDGTDWITTIHASDGRAAWQSYANSRGWRGGTPWQGIVADLALSMGLAVPPASLDAIQGASRGPYTVTGYAWREMDTIIAQLGLQWSIQDGAIQVVQADQATAESVVWLTPTSGLIGPVRFTDPKISRVGKNRTLRRRSAIELDALTQAEFKPGRRIRVDSMTCSGDYRIDSVEHRGDSWAASPFMSTLACSIVNAGTA